MAEWVSVWLFILCGMVGCAIWFDIRHRRVPNRLLLLVLIGQCLFLVVARWVPLVSVGPWSLVIMTHWLPALGTAVVTLVVLFPLWRFRAMGAGDVKFAAVLGFCMGPLGLLQAFLLGSVLAAFHSMLYLLQREAPWLLGRFGAHAVPKSTPYAAYLAIGVLAGVAWQLVTGQPWLRQLAHSG